MLRTVVTLLVVVPLLMPPGMCICQFAPNATAAAGTGGRTERGLRAGHTAAPHSDCRCDSCCNRTPAGGDERGPMPTDDAPPAGPGKHAPGCPAVLGDVPTKMAAPVVTLHFDAPGGFTGTRLPDPASPAGRGRERSTVSATSPPLFISHCSLQI